MKASMAIIENRGMRALPSSAQHSPHAGLGFLFQQDKSARMPSRTASQRGGALAPL
jgi:hypothetical protein